MAKLRTKDFIDVKTLTASDFEPDLGRRISRVIHIDKEGIVLVKETSWGELYYTFFDDQTMNEISRELRYKEEHGKEVVDQIEGKGLRLISIISVDRDTGLESFSDTVYKNGNCEYTGDRERYSNIPTTLLSEYSFQREMEEKMERGNEDFITNFYTSDFSKKTKLIRTMFKRSWRSSLQGGSSNSELFLSDELFLELDKDNLFRKSLLKALILEESLSSISARDVFDKIISHYSSS